MSTEDLPREFSVCHEIDHLLGILPLLRRAEGIIAGDRAAGGNHDLGPTHG
jgi:hypothetical protein